MTEREALYRAVCAAPHDDVPRLVFADWLDEHGDTDRAAFIRAQIEADRLPAGSCFRGGYEAAAEKYLRRHEAAWRAELPVVSVWEWGGFRRGFVDDLWITSEAEPVRDAARVFAQAPITRLQLSGEQSVVVFVPFLRHVRELKLVNTALTDGDLQALCDPHTDLQLGVFDICFEEHRWPDILSDAAVSALFDRFGSALRFRHAWHETVTTTGSVEVCEWQEGDPPSP